jgi:hypothetical protein
MTVQYDLHSNHTPHARRPLVAVALPTTGAPSTGSRVLVQKLESKIAHPPITLRLALTCNHSVLGLRTSRGRLTLGVPRTLLN